MKKFILTLLLLFFTAQISPAWSFGTSFDNFAVNRDSRQIKRLLTSQVRWANKSNFDKFISTYDKDYQNADGFDLNKYSELVKDIWNSYDKIKYGVVIKNISVQGDEAKAELIETSKASLPLEETSYNGELNSYAESVYYFKKTDGKWKVISDAVTEETTTMLYGEAKFLDIKMTVPKFIDAGQDYSAILEFEPPNDTLAIASLTSDLVEYPQKPLKEVFRPMPEDNILERLFTSNTNNQNEYIVASIGLTKTSICDLSIKLSLTGFGYVIKRVNVKPLGSKAEDDKN